MVFSVYKRFVIWWVSVLLIATSIFWANYFGVIQTIWENDTTKLTSAISVIFVLANIALGWVSYKTADPDADTTLLHKITDYCWFITEMVMALGMLGTVIGLIHMLDISATKSITDPSTISGMWKAMGLALYTNAVGLAASIVLKFQTSLIGVDNES